ncbi:MAG: conjugal transfer protein TrbL, partial [Eggerthellaceae bacterium]|nr:conjugal transfer protein TrbL [Eggerthellaceae bacterium]
MAVYAALLAISAVLQALVPDSAFAAIGDDINSWLCGLLRDLCNWIFAAQTDVLASIGYDSILGAPFSEMIASSGDISMYDIVHSVWEVAILPIGCGVLSLVFIIRLIEISGHMESGQSFPGVKEVIFLLVFFAVFLFLIQNSFELMG